MATVIDALIVSLGLDTKKFKEGEEESKKSLDNVKKHSEETAEAIAKQGEKAADFFKELISGALAFIGVMKSVEGIKEMVMSTLEADLATGRLAKKMHVATEELGGMQGAAVLAGGSISGFQESMAGLGGALADIHDKAPRAERRLDALTKAGVKGLQLGKRADIMDVMRQLSESVKDLNPFSASRLLGKAGITDAGTIQLLRKGGEEMAKLTEEALKFGVASDADVKASKEEKEATARLTLAKQQLGRIITQVVAPALVMITGLAGKISAWVNEHANGVKAGFIGIAFGIVAVGISALIASPEVLAFAAATIAATWPLIAIGAAVGSLVAGITWLVFKYKEWDAAGGETESKVGKFFAMLKIGWESIKSQIMVTMATVWGIIKDYVELISAELDIIFDFFNGDWDKLGGDLEKYFTLLWHMILRLLKLLEYELLVGFFRFTGMVDKLDSKISSLFQKWGSKVITWVFGAEFAPSIMKAMHYAKYLSGYGLIKGVYTGELASDLGIRSTQTQAIASQVTSSMAMQPMHSTQHSKHIETHINELSVNAPNATDSAGIVHSIREELQQHPLVDHAEGN